jgi:hypothetical protein
LRRWLNKALGRKLRNRRSLEEASNGSGKVTQAMMKKRRKHLRRKGFLAR